MIRLSPPRYFKVWLHGIAAQVETDFLSSRQESSNNFALFKTIQRWINR